jgi:hypothetical protein
MTPPEEIDEPMLELLRQVAEAGPTPVYTHQVRPNLRTVAWELESAGLAQFLGCDSAGRPECDDYSVVDRVLLTPAGHAALGRAGFGPYTPYTYEDALDAADHE